MKKKILWCITIILLFIPLFSIGNVQAEETFTPPSFGQEVQAPVTPPSFDPNSPNYGGNVGADVKKNLQNWHDDLSVADPLTSIVRGFGWWLIIQAGYLVNSITNTFNHVYQVLDLYGSEAKPGPIQTFIDNYMPIFVGIGIAVFIALTIGILFSKNQDVVLILKNILLGISIFVLLPFGFGQISSLTTNLAKSISTTSNSGYDIIDQNVTDLYAINKNYDWIRPKNESINNQKLKSNFIKSEDEGGKITKQILQDININETVDPQKMSKRGEQITSHMLVTNEKGQLTAVSLNDGVGKSWWMSLITGDAQYYRYHVNFFTIIFYIFLVLVITAFLLYKLIKILIDLVMNAGILQATALTDTKGKRNWEIISKIVAGFGAVVMVVFLQVFFSKGYEVTSTLKGGPVVQAIAGIALAFSVIEGPNVFQSTFGVHAGLDSGLKDLMTLSQTSMLLQSGGGLARGMANGMMNGSASALGAATGTMSGLFDKNNEEGSSDDKGLGDNTLNENNQDNDDDLDANNNLNDDLAMENQNHEDLDNTENIDADNISEDTGDIDEESMSETSGLEGTDPELMNLVENDENMYGDNGNDVASSQELSEQDRTAEALSHQEAEKSEPEEHTLSTKAPHSMGQTPHLGDLGKERPNLGQIGESPARAQGLGSSIRNLAQQSVSNKINAPNRNIFNSFTGSYTASQSLSKGAKNSIRSFSHSPIEE